MKRAYRKAEKAGFKICNRCEIEMPATPKVFLRDSSRTDGLGYECRKCHSKRKIGRDKRSDRWALLTKEQKEKSRIRQKKYGRTNKGRACYLRAAYKRIDACDLTTDEIAKIIKNPCIYCKTEYYNRGLDRIDNSKGHIKGNVVSCCTACNIARGDRFSQKEMFIIGAAIQKVFKDRVSDKEAGSARHREN